MAKKSTYQELEQRVKELEKEAAEHKRAEEALWESEAKYREVVERANDGIAIIQDGLLKYVNPRLAEMTGYGVEEGTGSPFTNYIDPAELPEAVEYYERRMAGEEVATRYERRLRHENGSMIDTEISGGLITFQHKPADLVVIRDITQRKRAEEEILRSTALLQSVFDGIAEPLIMLDKQLTVKMLNKPAIQYYQVEPQGVTGKPCHEAFKKKPEPCEGCNIPAAVLSGRSVTFERKGLMDPHRLEQVVIYPVRDEDSEVEGAIIHISDITEARFMEQQLIRSEKMASLGLLMSGVAHEINNPLAIINEKAGLIKDILGFADDFEYREKLLNLLDSILNSVERSRAITLRLLGFAKQKDVKMEMIRLNQLLKEVLGFLEREAFHRSINISLDFSPDLPTLESDKGELQQVFLNIIKNAFEAVENRGNVTIVTRLKDPDTLQATITDDGPGMAPKQLEHIFEPFHTSNKEWGTGLGLYITHDIVTKNLGGQIRVKSEVGKGTTFTVELPRARRENPNPSPKN
jgi:PAS domain S-box-containing protein